LGCCELEDAFLGAFSIACAPCIEGQCGGWPTGFPSEGQIFGVGVVGCAACIEGQCGG
jgi:hypothetical protein